VIASLFRSIDVSNLNFDFGIGKKKISSRSSRTIYVGNLPGDIREREVEDLFSKVKITRFF